MFHRCRRQCTYVGSSETVLVSSISCACLNHGNLASTGFFSGEEKKKKNKPTQNLSVISPKSNQYVDVSIIHLSTSRFTLAIDPTLLNRDTPDGETSLPAYTAYTPVMPFPGVLYGSQGTVPPNLSKMPEGGS